MDARTLWMGDLDPFMDESFIKKIFSSVGDSVTVKLIRDKATSALLGYCFIEFMSNVSANKALTMLNGTLIPSTNKYFKLNWASGQGPAAGQPGGGSGDFSVFVGDLAPEVTDFQLLEVFQAKYLSVKGAKVVTDPVTGVSKGYGFVRFGDEVEQQRSMMEMQGQYCGTRPIRVSQASAKYRQNYGIALATPTISQPTGYFAPVYVGYSDPDATVYIGNITPATNEDDIRSFFAGYGDIISIKIPPARGCAFVQFVYRKHAELAIQNMNGFLLCGSRVKLSWGKSTNTPSVQRPSAPIEYVNPYTQYSPLTASSDYSASYYQASLPATPLVPTFKAAVVLEDPLTPVKVSDANEMFLNQRIEFEISKDKLWEIV